MEILKKLAQKARDPHGTPLPVIAFLGDSVTHGCFDLVALTGGGMDTVYDPANGYPPKVAQILQTLYPTVPVSILNAGISGDTAPGGLARLERDVLSHRPDLTVICYGLNDANGGTDGLSSYREALGAILDRVLAEGGEAIVMTPNMMNTTVCPLASEEPFRAIGETTGAMQKSGILTAYAAAAREVAAAHGVPVCDAYAKWQRLADGGVDITGLLANHANHPTRELDWLFAYSLVETMFS